MTSLPRLHANRLNALKSTGPRTPAGKARAARNAAKHARAAFTPDPLPGESTSHYTAFAASVIADLNPLGPLESIQASRIAHLLWRIRRASLHESALAASRVRDAELTATESPQWKHRRHDSKALPASPAFIRRNIRTLRRAIPLLTQALQSTPALDGPDPLVNPDTAVDLLVYAAQHLGRPDLADETDIDTFPGISNPQSDASPRHYEWSLLMLRAALAQLADEAQLDPQDFTSQLLPALQQSLRNCNASLRRAYRELARFRRTCLLPEAAALRSLDRHESALERNLSRALSQFAFLQSQRIRFQTHDVTLAPQTVTPVSKNVTSMSPESNKTPSFPA